MRHTIDLSESSEQRLREIADETGAETDVILEKVAESLLTNRSVDFRASTQGGLLQLEVKWQPVEPVRSTPGVMGGDACIRDTRIPIWLLVQAKQAGYSDERILANYPGLNAADLTSAWDYYVANAERIDSQRRSHEEAA